MAGIKFSSRLKGYILLESVIAMIVVMICFGIATMIFNNVVSGSRSKLRVLARVRMQTEAMTAKSNKQFLDETIDEGEFKIQKKVLPCPLSKDFFRLQLIAVMPDGFQLDEYDEIISTH